MALRHHHEWKLSLMAASYEALQLGSSFSSQLSDSIFKGHSKAPRKALYEMFLPLFPNI